MSAAINPLARFGGVEEKSEFIDLLFSRPDPASEDFISREISKGICGMTRSEICHIDCEVNGLLVGAHSNGGIQARKPDYQAWKLRIRVRVPATKAQKAAYEAYVLSMVGTSYDTKSIFGIAFNDSSLHDSSRLICSAFGKLAVDDKSGIVIVRKLYYLTSPEELRIAASATAGARELRVEGNGPMPPFPLAVGAAA